MAEQKISLSQEQLIQMFQAEQEKMNSLNNSIQVTLQMLQENIGTLESLKTLKESKEKEEILVPLGANIFIKASLEKEKEIIMALTNEVTSKTSLEKAIKKLEEKEKKLAANHSGMVEEQQKIAINLQSLEKVIQSMLAQQMQQKK